MWGLQNRSRRFITTCRGSNTLAVEDKDSTPKVLPFEPIPGFSALAAFNAVLAPPSPPL